MQMDILKKIVGDRHLEARWLRTLSLLEHIGACKIGKTVYQTHPSLSVLEHHADEARHAFIFRKMAATLEAGTEACLCADEGIAYFQALDHGASAWMTAHMPGSSTYDNYVMTTCLIERRAMKLYPLYKAATRNRVVAAELQQVIAEETSHRHVIEEEAKKILACSKQSLDPLLDLEETLFHQFEKALADELNSAPITG